MTTFKPGDAVIYRPYDGAPPEDGVITRLSADPSLAFVHFVGQRPDASPMATPISQLEPLTWASTLDPADEHLDRRDDHDAEVGEWVREGWSG